MSETTEIEKKSLEAHVELCAERYRMLELKLETLETEINEVKDLTRETHKIIHTMSEKHNTQVIGWAVGLIGCLTAALAWMVTHYVLK